MGKSRAAGCSTSLAACRQRLSLSGASSRVFQEQLQEQASAERAWAWEVGPELVAPVLVVTALVSQARPRGAASRQAQPAHRGCGRGAQVGDLAALLQAA